MTKEFRTKLVIAIALAVLALGCRICVPYNWAVKIVGHWGYWVLLAGVFVYMLQLLKFIRSKSISNFGRAHWIGFLVAGLGTLFIELHEPRAFKVMYDEVVFAGIARNAHFLREVGYATKAHNVSDQLEVTQSTVDKRPFFFPLAVSFLHDLTGYRPENVFILNGIAVFALLFLTYILGVQYGGWRLGTTCVVLWLGLPLLAQAATSGGYDVFNLTMLMLTWYFGREYIRTGTSLSQSLFVLTAAYLAQVRHESILMLIAVGIIILIKWRRDKICQLGWATALSPLHLILPLMVNLIFAQSPGATQTSPGQAYFSLQYLQENLERAVWYLFVVNSKSSNSAILSLLGVISFVAFLVKMLTGMRKRLEEGDDILLFILGVIIFANFIIIQCNFWGQLDDPVASRFSLPLSLLFIICFAWVVKEWRKNRTIPIWLTMVAVIAVVLAIPAAARNVPTRAILKGREFAWFMDFLKAPEYRGALVITHPVGPIVYGHPAIGIDIAEDNKWKINQCLKQRMYPQILALETVSISMQTGEEHSYSEDSALAFKVGVVVDVRSTLSAAFKTEVVAEHRLRPNVVARVVRVVAVEGPGSEPPASFIDDKPPYKDMGAYFQHVYSMLP